MKKISPARGKRTPADFPYRELFELSPVPGVVLDSLGRFAIVNQAFARRLCLKQEALPGGSTLFEDVFEQPSIARNLLEELKEKRVVRRRDVRLKDGEGQTHVMLVSGQTLPPDRRYAFALTLMDITRQKQVEEALRRDHARLASLIEGIGAGVFLVDREGALTEINQTAADLLEISRRSAIGGSFKALLNSLAAASEEPEVVRHRLTQASLAVENRPAVEVSRKGKTHKVLEISFFPVRDQTGAPIGWGCLIQDVTHIRERQAWKVRLLSVLARDIRAPLAALKGHATALLANYRKWDEPMVQEFLNVINRRTDELIRDADRSLALTRVEAGSLGMQLEPVDVQELIRQAVDRALESFEDRRVALEIPQDLPPVRVDPARIEEVLVILLDNAARYTPADSPLGIRAEKEGGMLKVSVLDQGPGIDADRQYQLFDKNASEDATLSGGKGIGLYICRKFIEAHGGRMGVESPPEGTDHGTRIFFTIPFMPVLPPTPPDSGGEGEASTIPADGEKTVLVVEHEPDYQSLLFTILDRAGYEVVTAPDGPAAVDILQTSPPDIILMEWTLPGMDGLSLCRNIRRHSNVPILVITSKISQEDLVSALDTGADDYVTKPFQSPELLARIRSLLRRGDAWPEEEPERFEGNGLAIEYASREVWKHGKRLDLTPTEFDLLAFFSRHPGQVLEYDRLADRVFGSGTVHGRHDLFIHISRLRKKIEADSKNPVFIQTRWGNGYVFLPK